MNEKAKYALIGALAGLANGLFGAGGGLVLVPLLSGWIHQPVQRAFATSVAVILPLSIVSAVVYLLRGNLPLLSSVPYLVGGAVGGLLAGKYFRRFSMVWLRRIFGLLILYGGVRAVFLL